MTLTKTSTAYERMTRARLFAGLEQSEMAELLGRNRNTISAWERGLNEPPAGALAQWAVITGQRVEWIVWGDEGQPSATDQKVGGSSPFERTLC